jgi:predicted small metal-binding protein
MAKKFFCGDVLHGCSWSVTAKDEQDLFKKITEHAKNVHNISSIPEDVIQKVKSKIRDA